MPPTVNNRKRKQNGQCIRNKCKNKRRRVCSSERETKAKNIAASDGTELPERTPERAKYRWREGRRIVELGFLADQLKAGCSECKYCRRNDPGSRVNSLHSVRGMLTA